MGAAAETHRIRRLVFEVETGDGEDARRLQGVLGGMQDRLGALIEGVCDDLQRSEGVDRIERLTVDVGEVDADGFAEAFVAALRRKLSRALGEALGEARGREAAGEVMPADPEFEALVVFMRTGRLPWWSPTRSPTVVREGVASILESERATGRMVAVVREAARGPAIVTRLVTYLLASGNGGSSVDGVLARLVDLGWSAGGSRMMAAGEVFAGLDRRLAESPALAGWSERRRQALLWRWLWVVAVREGGSQERVIASVLDNLARDLGIAVEVLRGVQEERGAAAWIGWMRGQGRGGAPGRLIARLRVSEGVAEDRGAWLRGWVASAVGDAEVRALVEQAVVELEGEAGAWESVRAALVAGLRDAREGSRSGAATSGATEDVSRSVSGSTEDVSTAASELGGSSGSTAERGPGSERTEGSRTARGRGERRERKRRPVELDASEASEVCVEDAGLVILWPFIGHFFRYLGIVEGAEFRDAAAQHRAAALLRAVAGGDREVVEYQLPLARVLCGIADEVVVDPGPPISEEEEGHCVQLLEAVVAQATILGKMTPAGLRGSFLLREGLLGMRDGCWLLRVERRGYDVVLDRFPWTFDWVRLPWMSAPMRVEW